MIDALLPPEMALACETAVVAKVRRDALALIVLGVLAGAFIALGARWPQSQVCTFGGSVTKSYPACRRRSK